MKYIWATIIHLANVVALSALVYYASLNSEKVALILVFFFLILLTINIVLALWFDDSNRFYAIQFYASIVWLILFACFVFFFGYLLFPVH